jgi:hypothetical protein
VFTEGDDAPPGARAGLVAVGAGDRVEARTLGRQRDAASDGKADEGHAAESIVIGPGRRGQDDQERGGTR